MAKEMRQCQFRTKKENRKRAKRSSRKIRKKDPTLQMPPRGTPFVLGRKNGIMLNAKRGGLTSRSAKKKKERRRFSF